MRSMPVRSGRPAGRARCRTAPPPTGLLRRPGIPRGRRRHLHRRRGLGAQLVRAAVRAARRSGRAGQLRRGHRLDPQGHARHRGQHADQVAVGAAGREPLGVTLPGKQHGQHAVLDRVHGGVAEQHPGHPALALDRFEDLRPALPEVIDLGGRAGGGVGAGRRGGSRRRARVGGDAGAEPAGGGRSVPGRADAAREDGAPEPAPGQTRARRRPGAAGEAARAGGAAGSDETAGWDWPPSPRRPPGAAAVRRGRRARPSRRRRGRSRGRATLAGGGLPRRGGRMGRGA